MYQKYHNSEKFIANAMATNEIDLFIGQLLNSMAQKNI